MIKRNLPLVEVVQMKSSVQVVEDLPWRWNTQGVIFIIGGLGYMFDAWDVLLAPYLLPLLHARWGLSTVQLGLFGSAGLIGMGLGSIAWGTAADKIGHKRAFRVRVSIPESPMFLAKAGRKDEAQAVIEHLIARTKASVGEWSFTDSSPVSAKPLSPLSVLRGVRGICSNTMA